METRSGFGSVSRQQVQHVHVLNVYYCGLENTDYLQIAPGLLWMQLLFTVLLVGRIETMPSLKYYKRKKPFQKSTFLHFHISAGSQSDAVFPLHGFHGTLLFVSLVWMKHMKPDCCIETFLVLLRILRENPDSFNLNLIKSHVCRDEGFVVSCFQSVYKS